MREDLIGKLWNATRRAGAIGQRSRVARRFAGFGEGTIICFPPEGLINPESITLGSNTMIGPHCVLSAGWGPDQPGLPTDMLMIGDRCLLGKGSSIVCHFQVHIGHDVWTGHNIYITDMNHGYADPDRPISVQHQEPRAVTIGDGSWIGHGSVILPGANIGKHVVVGAGSVVTGDLPDYSVAVGAPARVVKRLEGNEWISE